MSGHPWRIVLVSAVPQLVDGLDAVCRSLGHEPVALVTTQGPKGRRAPLEPERAARFAELVTGAPPELDVLIPRDRHAAAPLVASYEPDLLICWGFSWLLPPELLRLPRLGCINIHPSALPRYRGPIPLAWALRNGDREIGVTVHRMDERFDTGAILAQTSVPLDDDVCTILELAPELGPATLSLLPGVFERLARGDAGEPQDDAAASYAPFFEEDYAGLDWAQPARRVHDQVRAWSFELGLSPARGPYAELAGERVRVTRTSLVEREGALRVECADGPIWVVDYERDKAETADPP